MKCLSATFRAPTARRVAPRFLSTLCPASETKKSDGKILSRPRVSITSAYTPGTPSKPRRAFYTVYL